MMMPADPTRDEPDAPSTSERESVVPLELFLDLVIVFAFTQVTGLLTAAPSWAG